MTVYLLTSGDGSDGDEWTLHGIFASQLAATIERIKISKKGGDLEFASHIDIEEWPVDD